jgi:hypothetical protein
MKFILFPLVFCLFTLQSYCQTKFKISGYVRDSASRETLIGATLQIVETGKYVSTNQYGYFSINVLAGIATISASSIGYLPHRSSYKVDSNLVVDIFLSSKSSLSDEIIISATKKDANVKNAQMGQIDLSMGKIKALPVLFGEVDPLKTLQLFPGITNSGEGNSGIYVRGGGPDQNLLLLDDAVVYNSGHLFGFFSIFNGDAIKNISIIKGGMPAQYGGRLSSVLDIAMKDGNMKKFQGEGGIGSIAARFSLQGPIKKDKSSFILSGRRTYIDALAKPFIKKGSQFDGSGYYFYDLNAKFNYRFSAKDRVYLSGYFGRDVFDFVNNKRQFNVNIPWGNSTVTARWNHVFKRNLFVNTTLLYNDYNFMFGARQKYFDFTLKSGIRDFSYKSDFDFFASDAHRVKFGVQATRHIFTPSIVSGKQDTSIFKNDLAQKKYSNELSAYVQDDWDISNNVKVNYGLRWSGFQQIGPYKNYASDNFGNHLDSIVYKANETVKFYNGLEPRTTVRLSLNETTSLKGSVSRNLQYIHLVSNAGTTLPTDIWVPSTLRVKPQISWQYATGFFKNFKNNTFETSIEVYYKSMQNQIEYKEGYTPSSKDTEEEFVFGKGWSYGAEFFVNKAKGRFTGWIGYTLAWTWRKFPQINSGNVYPAKYDRRHDLSVVGMYDLNKKWKLSTVFVYATGNATTLPEKFFIVEGVLSQQFSNINKYRLAPYHRLDLSATYTPTPKKVKKITGSWVFSVYNAYSRKNPYFYYFDQTGSPFAGTLQVKAKQVSLFPAIPSVTYNFKF